MRKIQTQDIFPMLRIINAADLKEDFKKIASTATGKIDTEAIGYDLIFKVLEKAANTKTEKAIYEFLSGIFECSTQEVKEMDLIKLVSGLKECADIESWKVFFRSVSALTTK